MQRTFHCVCWKILVQAIGSSRDPKAIIGNGHLKRLNMVGFAIDGHI